MSKTYGVGIIGAGNISTAYIKLAPLFRNLEVRAVADIVPAAAQHRASEFGLKAQTPDELLKNSEIDVVVNLFPARIRYWLHLTSLAFLAVLVGYLFYGAWTLVEESLLFSATDISVIRTPLAIPQGLWAFGIGVFFLLILTMLVEAVLLIIAGRGAETESMLHSRTYQEEVAEALEAVGEPVPADAAIPEVKP